MGCRRWGFMWAGGMHASQATPPAEPPHTYHPAGDNQSLGASLSTFSGHLARIQAVRKACTGRELVLLDEVGTGELAASVTRGVE